MSYIPEGFNGSSYQDRDQLQIEGSKEYQTSEQLEDRFNGKRKVIYSKFCKSLQIALSQKRVHPRYFHDYIEHWLYANGYTLHKDVKNLFIEYYGDYRKLKKPRIKKGSVIYI